MNNKFTEAATAACFYTAYVMKFNALHFFRGGMPSIMTTGAIAFVACGVVSDPDIPKLVVVAFASPFLAAGWIMGSVNHDGYASYEDFLETRNVRRQIRKDRSLNCG